MIDKKQLEESLKELPNEVEPNQSLVSDAEKLAKELYVDKKTLKPKKKYLRFMSVVCSLCIIIGLIAPITYYYLQPAEQPIIRNYTDFDLEKEEITDINEFTLENGLQIRYLMTHSNRLYTVS